MSVRAPELVRGGAVVEHCGHPTAVYPFTVAMPDGRRLRAWNGMAFRHVGEARNAAILCFFDDAVDRVRAELGMSPLDRSPGSDGAHACGYAVDPAPTVEGTSKRRAELIAERCGRARE